MKLNESKKQRLGAVLGGLSLRQIERLRAMIRAADRRVSDLLDSELFQLGPDAQADFFAPIACLVADKTRVRPSRAMVADDLADLIWEWVVTDSGAASALAALQAAYLGEGPPAEEMINEGRVRAATALLRDLDMAEFNTADAHRLRSAFAISDMSKLSDAARLLASSSVFDQLLQGVPEALELDDPAQSALVMERLQAAGKDHPFVADWLPFMFMARMSEPWRMIELVCQLGPSDGRLDWFRERYGYIGELVLRDLNFCLAGFEKPPLTDQMATDMIEALTYYVGAEQLIADLFTFERKDPWRRRIMGMNTTGLRQLGELRKAAREAYARVLPKMGRAGASFAPPGQGEPAFDAALAMGRFLNACRTLLAGSSVEAATLDVLRELEAMTVQAGQWLLGRLKSRQSTDFAGDIQRVHEMAVLLSVLGAAPEADQLRDSVKRFRAA